MTGSEKTGHFTNDFKTELLLPGCSTDLGQYNITPLESTLLDRAAKVAYLWHAAFLSRTGEYD